MYMQNMYIDRERERERSGRLRNRDNYVGQFVFCVDLVLTK